MKPSRRIIPSIAVVVAAAVTAGTLLQAAPGGHGHLTRPTKCKQCSDPCNPADQSILCIDSTTGGSFLSSFACCCCNDDWNHRSYTGLR